MEENTIKINFKKLGSLVAIKMREPNYRGLVVTLNHQMQEGHMNTVSLKVHVAARRVRLMQSYVDGIPMRTTNQQPVRAVLNINNLRNRGWMTRRPRADTFHKKA